MLTSACPGWICYAEKTHGDYILPFISNVKSPQQIMGSLVKHYLSHKLGLEPSQIYHSSIMPCYDKKLEASREDFYNSVYNTHDVDLVITSIEIEGMLKEKDIDLKLLASTSPDSELSFLNEKGMLLSHRGSSSGGYLEHVFIRAAKTLFDEDRDEIQYKCLRNKDFQEVSLHVNGEEKLKFAFAYGFRNIQNVVQKIKRKKCTYDFIEIMACPSGCVNGGGQIRVETKEDAKQLLVKTEDLYQSLPCVRPEDSEQMSKLRQNLTKIFGDGDSHLFRTEYHEIKKNVTALNIKW